MTVLGFVNCVTTVKRSPPFTSVVLEMETTVGVDKDGSTTLRVNELGAKACGVCLDEAVKVKVEPAYAVAALFKICTAKRPLIERKGVSVTASVELTVMGPRVMLKSTGPTVGELGLSTSGLTESTCEPRVKGVRGISKQPAGIATDKVTAFEG